MDRIIVYIDELYNYVKHHDRISSGRYFDEGRSQFFRVIPFRRCRKSGLERFEITYEAKKSIHIII